MQKDRRSFAKKTALAAVGVAAVAGTTNVLADTNTTKNDDLLKGHSPKKEILYKRTPAWDLYYETARN